MQSRFTWLCLPLLVAACDCGGGQDELPPWRKGRVDPIVVLPEAQPTPVVIPDPNRVRVNQVALVDPIVRGPRQIDVFEQEEAVVDILWVVDNSGSLSNERMSLAAEFDRFVRVLLDADVDFHIGVTSTDFVSINAEGGLLRGNPAFIDRMTPNPTQVFTDAVSFPNDMEIRLEEGFRAMKEALTPPNTNGRNAGFLRDDAGLGIIVVSDEDDGSLGRTGQYVRFLQSLKGPGRDVNVSLSAVIGLPPDGCIPRGEEQIFGAEADAAERYAEAANSTGGLLESICNPNFAPFVEALATTLAGLRKAFPLSAPPSPATIEVTVNGMRIPESPTIGWTLRLEDLLIVFEGSYVPPPGAEVRIEYDVAL